MNKPYFEMSEAERELETISTNLNHAICTVSEGIKAEFVGLTTKEVNTIQNEAVESLLLASEKIDSLINALV